MSEILKNATISSNKIQNVFRRQSNLLAELLTNLTQILEQDVNAIPDTGSYGYSDNLKGTKAAYQYDKQYLEEFKTKIFPKFTSVLQIKPSTSKKIKNQDGSYSTYLSLVEPNHNLVFKILGQPTKAKSVRSAEGLALSTMIKNSTEGLKPCFFVQSVSPDWTKNYRQFMPYFFNDDPEAKGKAKLENYNFLSNQLKQISTKYGPGNVYSLVNRNRNKELQEVHEFETYASYFGRYRNNNDTIAYRFWFFDIDKEITYTELVKNLKILGLFESLLAVIETSPNKFHLYFKLVDDTQKPILLQNFSPPLKFLQTWSSFNYEYNSNNYIPLQKSFIKYWNAINLLLNGDPACSNPLRIAQVPGLYNPKSGYLTKLLYTNKKAKALTLPKAFTLLENQKQKLKELIEQNLKKKSRKTKSTIKGTSIHTLTSSGNTAWEHYLIRHKLIEEAEGYIGNIYNQDITGNRNAMLLLLARFARFYIKDTSNYNDLKQYFDTILKPFFTGRTSKDLKRDPTLKQQFNCFRSCVKDLKSYKLKFHETKTRKTEMLCPISEKAAYDQLLERITTHLIANNAVPKLFKSTIGITPEDMVELSYRSLLEELVSRAYRLGHTKPGIDNQIHFWYSTEELKGVKGVGRYTTKLNNLAEAGILTIDKYFRTPRNPSTNSEGKKQTISRDLILNIILPVETNSIAPKHLNTPTSIAFDKDIEESLLCQRNSNGIGLINLDGTFQVNPIVDQNKDCSIPLETTLALDDLSGVKSRILSSDSRSNLITTSEITTDKLSSTLVGNSSPLYKLLSDEVKDILKIKVELEVKGIQDTKHNNDKWYSSHKTLENPYGDKPPQEDSYCIEKTRYAYTIIDLNHLNTFSKNKFKVTIITNYLQILAKQEIGIQAYRLSAPTLVEGFNTLIAATKTKSEQVLVDFSGLFSVFDSLVYHTGPPDSS